jgi:hypothetical protein
MISYAVQAVNMHRQKAREYKGISRYNHELMKKLISLVSVVLLLAVSIAAQVEDNKPKFVDEFGKMPLDEMKMRIDSLARDMKSTPNSKALIRIYGGQDVYFGRPYVLASVMKAIWENNLEYPPEELQIQFCSINNDPIFTRFFIVRENDKPDVCDENVTVPKQAVLIDTVEFYTVKFKLVAIDNLAIDFGYSDSGEYSLFSQDVLKKLLNDFPESHLYLIAYLKANSLDDGNVIKKKKGRPDSKLLAKRMFQSAKSYLIKNGVAASQIVTINGGYKSGFLRSLEFWFVPAGGEIPKPKPDYFPKKKTK